MAFPLSWTGHGNILRVSEKSFVDWFRQAGPYINAHRNRTFVISFGGEAATDARLASLVQDLALLHSLGIRLVLVHGARPQIEARLRDAGQQLHYADDLRVTDTAAIPFVKQAVGQVRLQLEAHFSMGLPNSPLHGARIRAVSGNFVTARPLGVRDGVDFGLTGEVRRIDTPAIGAGLNGGAIVLLSPLGYSPTGEVFNLNAEEVAVAAASALRADKLLFLVEGAGLTDGQGVLLRQLSPSDASHLLAHDPALPADTARYLNHALRACRAGVRRTHLLSRAIDGALLLELFTRDGVGTLLSADMYEGVRSATIDDVGGILELIRPLESEGVLVRRSRELLEMEIERFIVLERDGATIGCAALYPSPAERIGELACLAVDPDYRNQGRAEILLRFIEREAARQELERLFVLTTRTAHWFQEHGFEPMAIEALPVHKQSLYNWQRRSKAFVKVL